MCCELCERWKSHYHNENKSIEQVQKAEIKWENCRINSVHVYVRGGRTRHRNEIKPCVVKQGLILWLINQTILLLILTRRSYSSAVCVSGGDLIHKWFSDSILLIQFTKMICLLSGTFCRFILLQHVRKSWKTFLERKSMGVESFA